MRRNPWKRIVLGPKTAFLVLVFWTASAGAASGEGGSSGWGAVTVAETAAQLGPESDRVGADVVSGELALQAPGRPHGIGEQRGSILMARSPEGRSVDTASGVPQDKRVVQLTVAQAVAMATARNPSLEQSRLNVVLAELAEHRARLDRFSASVDVQAGYLASVNWDPFTDVADQDLLGHSTNYSTTAVVSVPLYAGGAQNSRVKRSELKVAGSKSDLAVSERELERAVYQAYWTIQGYALQEDAAREGLEQSREAVAIIQAKVDSGLAAPIELNQVKVDVISQEQRLAQLELAAYSARQTLARLLHLEGVTLELTEKAEDVTLGPWPDDPDTLVERAVPNRPELEGLNLSLEAARCDRNIARSGYFPVVSLDLSASGGNTALWTDPDTFDNTSFSPTVAVTAGLNVSWNLFNNFNTRYQVAQADTIIEQWKAQAAAEYDSIAAEVRTALETWKNLKEREAGVRAQVELATDNLTILQTLYSQGNASLLDLLNAQSEYRNALTQAASFQVDMVSAEYDLRWSAGVSSGTGGGD